LQSISNFTAGSRQFEKVSYKAKLRHLATFCDFGEYLDQALQDRLACRLRSEAMEKAFAFEIRPHSEARTGDSSESGSHCMEHAAAQGRDATTFSVESVAVSNRK